MTTQNGSQKKTSRREILKDKMQMTMEQVIGTIKIMTGIIQAVSIVGATLEIQAIVKIQMALQEIRDGTIKETIGIKGVAIQMIGTTLQIVVRSNQQVTMIHGPNLSQDVSGNKTLIQIMTRMLGVQINLKILGVIKLTKAFSQKQVGTNQTQLLIGEIKTLHVAGKSLKPLQVGIRRSLQVKSMKRENSI